LVQRGNLNARRLNTRISLDYHNDETIKEVSEIGKSIGKDLAVVETEDIVVPGQTLNQCPRNEEGNLNLTYTQNPPSFVFGISWKTWLN
jgi:hypothetical protein